MRRWLVSALLPLRHPEGVIGDLAEESCHLGRVRGALFRGLAIGRISVRAHAGLYRDERIGRGAVLLLTAGLGLLVVLRWATWGAAATSIEFDPLSRSLLAFWGAPDLPAALAAGLIAGRSGTIPTDVPHPRAHVVLVLAAVLASTAPSLPAGALAVTSLGLAAGLGYAALRKVAV